MAIIQSIHKCVILALIACHAILTTEGRQLRSTYKKESTSTKASLTERKKKILAPIGYGDSAAAHKDGFRPTTPGKSPGVDHSFAQAEGDVESKLLSDGSFSTDGYSVTGFKDDFLPSAPGHSTGVRHKNAEPKA